MSGCLEPALAYARRGWPVFPVRANKKPYVGHGVLEATTEEAQIREWWARWPNANVALDCYGAGLLVIDYDPGHDPSEVERALGGPAQETGLASRTPRGGYHEFYALAGRDPVSPGASVFADHVDVRCFHSYVLLPPSRTKDGAYEWDEQGEPAAVGDRLYDACKPAKEKSDARDEWIIEADLEENVAEAAKWLREKAKPAVEGQGGDATSYATAAMMKSFGLSAPTALELMMEHWLPRCATSWAGADAADWLGTKIENAYRYNTSPPGNMTAAYQVAKTAQLFEPVVEAMGATGRQATSGRFRIVDRQGMKSIAPPEWLVPEVLPEEGYAILAGQQSSLKTFVALDLSLLVATGGLPPWESGDWKGAHARPVKPGPVVYVAGEGRAEMTKRVRAWEAVHLGGQEAQNFYLADPVPRVFDGRQSMDEFVATVRKFCGDKVRLIVLDTIGRAMQGVNENSQEDASAFTAIVDRLRLEFSCAVLGLHHVGHGDGNRPRGSTVFSADADVVYMLARPQEKGKLVRLSMFKDHKDAAGWPEPRWIEAREVQLGLDLKSLALVKATKAEADKEERSERRAGKTTLAAVDARVAEVLRAHPVQEFRDAALAVLAASWRGPEGDGETLGVEEQTIRKTWLPKLRVEDCLSRKYWQPSKKVWRCTRATETEEG